MSGIVLWAIVPRAQLPKNISNILRTAALRNIATPVLDMLRQTTSTWNRQITFSQKRNVHVHIFGDDLYLTFTVEDQIWNWLEAGTEIRHYSFGEDFVPKTVVGQLQSGPGNWMGKYYNPGQPGIDARGWWDLIVEEMNGRMSDIQADIQAEVLNKSGLRQWQM